MTRPKLRSSGQPAWLRLLLGLYEALASLKLAVFVIAASAVVLGWATVVESRYGTPAVHFAIYKTWWFALLLALLGVNVLCAALIRYPWKKYQTGFLITHAGILVLLVGCLQSRMGGIDAQMPIFEGRSGHVAYERTQHFSLQIVGSDGKPRTVEVPFASGPFNWDRYAGMFPFPWWAAHRDQGVIYDRDGISLEVLDYLSDSRRVPAPPLVLQVDSRAPPSEGSDKPGPRQQQIIELDAGGAQRQRSPHEPMGFGSRKDLPGGERIAFWVAGSLAETEAFRHSAPDGPLGDLGQVVLWTEGRAFHFPVAGLQGGERKPLGDSGIDVELADLNEQGMGLVLELHYPDGRSSQMVLMADLPEFNQSDAEHGVFGTYWPGEAVVASSGDEPPKGQLALHRPQLPRIDVLQGADGQLYFRTWRPGQVEGPAKVAPGRKRTVAFAHSDAPVSFSVEKFTPHHVPGFRIESVPFDKDNQARIRRALVRLTVDGRSEQFWLQGLGMRTLSEDKPGEEGGKKPRALDFSELESDQWRLAQGDGRRVAVTLAWDQVDVGFNVYLHNFQRKLDPGTSQASHYSSLVDFRTHVATPKAPDRLVEKTLQENVLITLNQPVNFSDPNTGRSYRLYQEAFNGPWKPGDPQYHRVVPEGSRRDLLFLSILTVNYDPGRGLKYAGCLMIVAGTATMFYMRAYFFRPRHLQEGEAAPTYAGHKPEPTSKARPPHQEQPVTRG